MAQEFEFKGKSVYTDADAHGDPLREFDGDVLVLLTAHKALGFSLNEHVCVNSYNYRYVDRVNMNVIRTSRQ